MPENFSSLQLCFHFHNLLKVLTAIGLLSKTTKSESLLAETYARNIFLFYKALLFYYVIFALDTDSLMRRNGRQGEVDEKGESGEYRNSGENLPQFWRIFKLDDKRDSLESGDLKKMANLAKNRQRIDVN